MYLNIACEEVELSILQIISSVLADVLPSYRGRRNSND